MTICFFSAQYLPTVGGVERYTYNLANELIEKGHNVIIVTSLKKGLKQYEKTENGIIIYRLPALMLMNGRFPVIFPNKQFFKLKKQLQNEKIDFSVIQTRFYTNSLFGANFCYKNKIPSIVIEHGSAHLLHGGIVGFLGNIYEHIAFRLIKRKCKDIYGVSKISCEWLKHFNVNTQNVLYNAVDLQVLENTITEKAMREIESVIIPNIKTVVCFSGRFIPEKGIVPLLQAFKEIVYKYKDTQLVMAGDGPLLQTAKDMDVENVTLIGEVNYPKSLALFKRSDIFCLPTYSEGFATTVLEAAALNTAIVTTKTGGSPELIKNNEYGLLFDDMTKESIFNALDTALSNKEWQKTSAKNAQKRLIEKFTWEKVSEKLIDIAQGRIENESTNSNTSI